MPEVKARPGLWGRLVRRGDAGDGGDDRSVVVNGMRVANESIDAARVAATALTITGPTPEWARIAAVALTAPGADGCEAGIDRLVPPAQTPDGRPGIRVLAFAATADALELQLAARLWLALAGCPGAACYSGLRTERKILLGAGLRQFGDGFQAFAEIGGRRYLRLPVMDGEFVCEAKAGLIEEALSGAALLVTGRTSGETLAACEAATAAMRDVADCILPAPGGIFRAAIKSGSRDPGLKTSIDEAFCPTLTALAPSALPPDAGAAFRITVNGLSAQAITAAFQAGFAVLTEIGAKGGLIQLSAAPSRGRADPQPFPLWEFLA